MSAAATHIVRTDAHGVILRYPLDPSIDWAGADKTPDRTRCLRKRAQRELTALETIFDCLPLSDAGQERVWYALRAIRAALDERT